MVFFSLIVLTKVPVNTSQIVVTLRYVTVVLTINLFSDGKRLLMVFFSLIVLTKVTVNSSQVLVTCRYVTMVFTINLFFNGKRLLKVFFSLIVLVKILANKALHSKIIRLFQLISWLVIKIIYKIRA